MDIERLVMETDGLQPIIEGKTKRIFSLPGNNPTQILVESKNVITAGDGEKHDIIQGKAELSTQTTSNVFRLLKDCEIPVAFVSVHTPTQFIAPRCTMLPYEVVVRREAHGSYLKRSPHLMCGHIFPRFVVEFFLKTSGKKWKNHELVCDDPLIAFDWEGNRVLLYHPKQTMLHQTFPNPFLELPMNEVVTVASEEIIIDRIEVIARHAFLVLEKAWQIQGIRLVDCKFEFGIDTEGKLLLADVVDNDSWRIVDKDGKYMDKQRYRDGDNLGTVTELYKKVAQLTDRFDLPYQRVILWRGSDEDCLNPFYDGIAGLKSTPKFGTLDVMCSMHKQPVLAYRMLQQHVQEVPDSVIIVYVGKSNGAGPALAANTTVPVIAVPAKYKEFPDDVWSSLRAPSFVPVMTVLEPANAMLAALQILAIRNPSIYAALRFEQERRLTAISSVH